MNRATRIIVATLSVLFGLSGMSHGFFETLQGYTSTGGLYIMAIGEAQRMWPHGSEPAFTLIPNFLLTGIAAMLAGLAIIVWSTGFLHRKHGASVLLLLFVVLLLVGGGVAQILFFPWIWLVATRINRPLTWWRKVLPRQPGSEWLVCLTLSSALLFLALVIATTGFIPGMQNPDAIVTVMLVFLAAEVILLPLTFLAGFAHDLAVNLSSML
jgi:hypothetical protein